jgi:hypothetical protein
MSPYTYAHIPKEKYDKFAATSIECIYIGYSKIARPTNYTTSPPEGSLNPKSSYLMKEQVHQPGSPLKWGPPYSTPQNHK